MMIALFAATLELAAVVPRSSVAHVRVEVVLLNTDATLVVDAVPKRKSWVLVVLIVKVP